MTKHDQCYTNIDIDTFVITGNRSNLTNEYLTVSKHPYVRFIKLKITN